MRPSQSTNKDKRVLKIILVGKNKEMFEALMNEYNLSYNTEVFLFILKKIYKLEFESETK